MAKFPFARIMLNTNKAWNSSFYCPLNNCHLTKQSPGGVIHVVTNTIMAELLSLPVAGLIDLDNVIDLKNGCFKDMPDEEIEAQQEEVEFVIPENAISLDAPKEDVKDNTIQKKKKNR